MNQREAIWRHLRRTGRIDPLTALRRYGCFRLSARIMELRRLRPGRIRTVIASGRGKHWAVYKLMARGA